MGVEVSGTVRLLEKILVKWMLLTCLYRAFVLLYQVTFTKLLVWCSSVVIVLIFSTVPLFAQRAIWAFLYFIHIKAFVENIWVNLATWLSSWSSGLVLVCCSSCLVPLGRLQPLPNCWTWSLADAPAFGGAWVINSLARPGNACPCRSKGSILLVLILKKRIGLDLVILDNLIYVFLILRPWVQSDHILLRHLAITFRLKPILLLFR